MITPKRLRQLGYRQVASELHSHQLIRWWLKHLAKQQQRNMPERCLFDVLAIKPGAWVKVYRSNFGQHKAILVWRGPIAPSACQKCDGEGWLWWNELEHYDGPANITGEDDTRYPCDGCNPR